MPTIEESNEILVDRTRDIERSLRASDQRIIDSLEHKLKISEERIKIVEEKIKYLEHKVNQK
jgi:hypothetical protein